MLSLLSKCLYERLIVELDEKIVDEKEKERRPKCNEACEGLILRWRNGKWEPQGCFHCANNTRNTPCSFIIILSPSWPWLEITLQINKQPPFEVFFVETLESLRLLKANLLLFLYCKKSCFSVIMNNRNASVSMKTYMLIAYLSSNT